MAEVKNEYIKAQELAIVGYDLGEIDVKKAVKDKLLLSADCINGEVAEKIDAYITRKLIAIEAVQEVVKERKVVKVKEDKKKKD